MIAAVVDLRLVEYLELGVIGWWAMLRCRIYSIVPEASYVAVLCSYSVSRSLDRGSACKGERKGEVVGGEFGFEEG